MTIKEPKSFIVELNNEERNKLIQALFVLDDLHKNLLLKEKQNLQIYGWYLTIKDIEQMQKFLRCIQEDKNIQIF